MFKIIRAPRTAMIRHLLIVSAAALPLLFTACSGEKSEAEKQEEERVKLRELKRQNAAKYYRVLSEQFSDHPKAKEAAGKAIELEAKTPKK